MDKYQIKELRLQKDGHHELKRKSQEKKNPHATPHRTSFLTPPPRGSQHSVGGGDELSHLNPGLAIVRAVLRDLRSGRLIVKAQTVGSAGDHDSD
jgi:hypothetical protein